MTRSEIKHIAKKITNFNCIHIQDNGAYWTVSNNGMGISFGAFKDELKSAFTISRFDGGSFDVVKG